MTVDKSKQTEVFYVNVDVEVHCYCGKYIQNCDEINIVTCPDCGQMWLVAVTVADIDEHNFKEY